MDLGKGLSDLGGVVVGGTCFIKAKADYRFQAPFMLMSDTEHISD
jgi:hypothetical protein